MDDAYAVPWVDENGVSLDQEPLDDGIPFGGDDPTAESGKTGKKQSPAFKGGFFQMPLVAFYSEQHVRLGLASKAVLTFVLSKYRPGNNGRIGASTREAAEKCGINKSTANISFRELAAMGFLDCVTEAKLVGREWLSPEWRLTFLRCDVTGAPASNKFLSIKPATKPKPKAS